MVRLFRKVMPMAMLWAGLSTQAATLSCSTATTLEALVDCISVQMPQDSSNGYVSPTAQQRSDFRLVFAQMLQGNCNITLPSSLRTNMQIRTFTDSGNGRDYCLLMEVADGDNNGYVDKGWGTFITYADAVREVHHQAPHPKLDTSVRGSLGDSYTDPEGVRIFKQSDSRSFAVCGARRGANTTSSTCQSSHRSSDCAHSTDNLLHASTEELMTHYGSSDFSVIQWHGMAESTCSETAYISHGYSTNPPTGAKVTTLRDKGRIALPSWVINTPDTSCSLNATDNPQGRLLNGVAAGSVCGTTASAAGFGNRFLHIEQDVPAIGTDLSGVASAWSRATVAAFPAATAAPGTPTGLSAQPGDAKVSLTWTSSSGASSYNVKRSTISGGPYTTVASPTSTSFTSTGLTNGTTYHYVVSAVNSIGQSANSSEVSATPAAIPPAPTDLTATAGAQGTKTIALGWSASTGTTSYNVKRATSSGGTYSIIATGLSGTTYNDTGLQAGKTYHYHVTATNPSGTSGNSNRASVTVH